MIGLDFLSKQRGQKVSQTAKVKKIKNANKTAKAKRRNQHSIGHTGATLRDYPDGYRTLTVINLCINLQKEEVLRAVVDSEGLGVQPNPLHFLTLIFSVKCAKDLASAWTTCIDHG